ncbi:MAG: DNA polymerase III subunit delta [Gemmatimonadales bacterium]
MARETLETLLRALRQGKLAPVYYLYGPEETLKDEAVAGIVDGAIDPVLRDFNLEQRSAGQLDAEALDSLLNTLPMLSGRRVVVLRDLEALKKKAKLRAVLVAYLEKPAVENVVVLLQSAAEPESDNEVAARSFSVEVGPLPPERVVKWLLHHAERAGITLEPGAAEHLAAATGHDLATLRLELEKLGGLAEKRPVSIQQVGDLVGVRHGETLHDWRDAVLGDQTVRALRLLPTVLEQSGVSGVKLATALGSGLVGLGLARAHYDRGVRGRALEGALLAALQRARPFGLPEWKGEVAKWGRWVEAWPVGRVAAGLRAALAADQTLKSTRISDERGVLTDLIGQLHLQNREAA